MKINVIFSLHAQSLEAILRPVRFFGASNRESRINNTALKNVNGTHLNESICHQQHFRSSESSQSITDDSLLNKQEKPIVEATLIRRKNYFGQSRTRNVLVVSLSTYSHKNLRNLPNHQQSKQAYNTRFEALTAVLLKTCLRECATVTMGKPVTQRHAPEDL